MAHRTFYVTRDQRHPLYKTRMLTAGQELNLSASAARLFGQLGVEMSDEAPKRAAKPTTLEPDDFETLYPEPVLRSEALKPAAKKATPKRRKAGAKKTK